MSEAESGYDGKIDTIHIESRVSVVSIRITSWKFCSGYLELSGAEHAILCGAHDGFP